MNRKKIEQWILLEQSGELPTRLQPRLAAALRQNPELRNWKTAVQQLPELITPSKAEPRQSVIFNILREARNLPPPPTARPAALLLKPALALTLLALALFNLPALHPGKPPENPAISSGWVGSEPAVLETWLLGHQTQNLLDETLTEETRVLDFFFRGELHI